ncbi:MAG: GatB/YqeY domain-containing protein [Desulfobacterales bacterium]|nr:GatB/YqeY domain-containing protein [Desulfobacterales bacterium]
MWRKFFPFLDWGSSISRESLRCDLIAGLTGAVIVLPQGVAFAMIAGLPPEYGLYTAIITPIVAALFGSSLHLISGPTTAISIVVFSAISPYAEPGSIEFIRLALTLTFLAGVYQLAFGLARLGALVNFISHTVIVGFTAGAAILIATNQLKHIFNMQVPDGESFLHTWMHLFLHFNDINGYSSAVAGATLVSAIVLKRLLPRWPHMLLAMIVGSVTCKLLDGSSHQVRLIGQLQAHLPPLSLPDFSIGTIRQLAPEAFAAALLGLIEALSISRSIAVHSLQRIDGNQEFIGQGLSNLIGSFFSSYAGTGSFTRSAINYQAGAKTPLAAIFSAIFLALILLLIAPLTAYLPVAAMGGIILLVAYHLIDFSRIITIIKTSKHETAILLTTFSATLFLELEFSIYAGVLLSLVFYLKRTAHPQIIHLAPDSNYYPRRLKNSETNKLTECPQIKIIRIDGSLFFGAIHHVADSLYRIRVKFPECKYLLIVANGINFIDMAGAEMLVQEIRYWRYKGGDLFLSGLKPEAEEILQQGNYLAGIGKENLFDSKANALTAILKYIDPLQCRKCTQRIFFECRATPDRCSFEITENRNLGKGGKMKLQEQIKKDLTSAMKAKDEPKKETLRVIIGEFGRLDKKELSDEEVIKVLKKLIKSEKELLEKKGETEDSEFIKIIENYVPKTASEQEIVAWINQNIDFSKFKNKMQAMSSIMKHFGSLADGNEVKKILEKL